jgi:hypothetical protein
MSGDVPPLSQYALMAWCSVKKHRYNFIFVAFRTALGPTQPPIQWVPEVVSLGVKWPRREVYHSPPSSAEVK